MTEDSAAPGAAPGIVAGRGTDEQAEDEHAELERLRSEVGALRAEQAGQAGHARQAGRPGQAGARHDWWRAPIAAIAIVLGCVLAPISVLGVWASNQVTNTDRYVANMAPLISEPPIQQALSTKITAAITKQLNVKGLEAQAVGQLDRANLPGLSSLLQNFSGQISAGIDGAIGSAVTRVVASPPVAQLWTQANRRAHAGLVKVLSGQGNSNVSVINGQVTISLGPFIAQAKQQLSQRGLTVVDKLPAVNPTIALFEAPDLSKAKSGYRLVATLKWVLPILSLALLAVGIYAARRRRRALLGAALGLSASMLVLAAALAIARGVYLNSVPTSTLPPDAAAVLFDTLVRFIKDGLRVLLVAGLVIAAGAFLTGPSAAAVATRHAARSGLGWVRARGELAGLRTGPAGAWTGAHKRLLRIGAVAIAALVFVFWGQPTVAVAVWIVIVLLVALGLIELIGGGRAGDSTAGDTGAGNTAGGNTAGGDTAGGDTGAGGISVPAQS